ncbi:MAG TPA: gliding motility-associated C-terminal domain-containing protein, partial [Ohtaekwangia sp.]|uniref:gliding motility-associated C-terminal domain-containing protein n=1 Tax=Ohtaekwangia sp. TaxID=2066019 RepID=UPI002F954B1B
NYKASATYSGLQAAYYTVVAVDKVTRCATAKATVQVLNNTTLPAITTSTVDQTICNAVAGSGNGQASANVGGVTAGYTFTWYAGAGTSGLVKSNSFNATGLDAGVYTVKVTNNTTGCSNTAQVTINNNPVAPVVTAVVDANQTICSSGNGQVSATVGGTASGYIFYWFIGNIATPNIATPDFTGAVYSGRTANYYTVVAVSTSTNCQSAKATVQVLDNTVLPVVSATPSSNTACDPAKSNGSISANVGGVTTNHTFHIFSGQNTNPANEVAGSPAAVVSGLAAGIYTIQAIDNATGCAGTTEATITNNITLPTISAVSADVTNCSPANGSITASVSIGAVGDYTFSWYNGKNQKAIPDYTETSNVLSGIGAGDYTVSAVNNVLGCDVQAPVTVNVINAPATDITITQLLGERVIPAICNAGTGQLGAQASSAVNTAGFAFSWYLGDKNVGMTFEGNGQNFPVNSNRISNAASGEPIKSGLHTVIAVDNTTGCKDSLVINLPYSDEAALLSILTFPQTNCAVPDGAFDATITPSPGTIAANPTIDQTWYDVQVYQKGLLMMTVHGALPSTVVNGLAAGNYTILAKEVNPALPGCTSAPNDITIVDNTTHPVVTANALNDNKNCTGAASGNGSIELAVDGTPTPAAGYTYKWTDGKLTSDPVLPAGNILAPGHTAFNITEGFYTVEVTNTVNGCKTNETFNINSDPYAISIATANLVVTDQTDCLPVNGSASVTDVLIDGASSGGTAGYTFVWFANDGTTVIPASGNGPVVGALLAADTYFVKATNTASNCASPLVEFIVDDKTNPPAIIATTLASNTNCSGVIGNGTITIQINGGAPVTDFTIDWFEGTGTTTPLGTTVGVTAGLNKETAQQLLAGTYTVRVIDNTTPGNTCETIATFTITDDLPVISIDQADLTLTDQTDCNPVNGSAQVTDILVDGTAIGGVAGYTFNWYESDGTTAIAGAGNAATIGVALAVGNYTVEAINTTSNCRSSITPFTIKDVHVDPNVVLVQTAPNLACNTSYTGQLSASVTEGTTTGVTAGYQFDWFTGINNTTPADLIGSGPVISNLQEGDYTVRVTDINAPNGNCATIKTIYLKREIPVLNNLITVSPQTLCPPAIDGSIVVNKVTQVLMGTTTTFDMTNPADLANFSFQWFDAAQNPITAVIPGNPASPSLLSGTYYVQVTNTLGCASTLTVGVVEDHTAPPVITLDAFSNPAVCILPEVTGSLSVIADNSPNLSNYTFTWYSGATASGAAVDNDSQLNGIPYTATGIYTVRVTNNATNCFADATYKFATDTVTVQTLASAVPLSSCVTANGSLFATVSKGDGNLYSYDWFKGTVVGTTPDFTGSEVLTAPMGMYTAIAKHPTLSFCTVLPDTTTITDGRIYPMVNITPIAPLTYCDPAKRNGAAQADVGGKIVGYTFDWYEGAITSGQPYYTGSQATNLGAKTYFVQATDVLTGCTGNNSIVIQSAPVPVPMPQVVLVANRTDCVELNGELSASVNGNITDYTFQWYNGTAVKNQPDATGEVYALLDAGQYIVTAVERISGCASAPVPGTVQKIFVYPDFILKTTPSTCSEENGTVQLIPQNNSDIQTIEWDINGVTLTGPMLEGLPAGFFQVTAYTSLHCDSTKLFEIKPEINVYNAVSNNRDGMNDFFEIGCIESYPNNRVRIYNRAGTLVYEQKGYNNVDMIFNGVSNKGISVLGNHLPDGTYFYIIEKGDGSDAKTGYLELLN